MPVTTVVELTETFGTEVVECVELTNTLFKLNLKSVVESLVFVKAVLPKVVCVLPFTTVIEFPAEALPIEVVEAVYLCPLFIIQQPVETCVVSYVNETISPAAQESATVVPATVPPIL